MSRSKRRTPIFSVFASSEKRFKAFEHRRERRAAAIAVQAGEDAPHVKHFGDPWNGPKDGKAWNRIVDMIGPGRPWDAK